MGFIADQLHEMQDRRVMIEDYRLIFLSKDVNDLFALGNGGKRLIDDLQRRQCRGSRAKLA